MNFILKLLNEWAKRVGKTLDEDIGRSLSNLLAIEPSLAKNLSGIELLLRTWHSRLLKACQAAYLPSEGLLAGFSALCDCSLPAQELFKQWSEYVEEAQNTQDQEPPAELSNQKEALASLLQAASNPPAPKLSVTAPLFEALRGIQGWECGLGGASAHIAKLFGELGLKVCLVNLYHPVELARHFPSQTKRLAGWDESKPLLQDANREQEGAPLRTSYIIYYQEGEVLGGLAARATDRVVLRFHHWLGPQSPSEIKVRDVFGNESAWDFRGTVQGEWPWIPGFVVWKRDDNFLCFEFAPLEALETLAREFRYMFLSGLGINAPLGRGPQVAKDALWHQLRRLAENGVKIHFEFSGKPSPNAGISKWRRSLSDIVFSAGINDGELFYYTELSDCNFSSTKHNLRNVPRIFERYLRALFLARTLKLKRLYVHGNDVDLILLKEATPGVMRSEVMADLLGKGLVILFLLQRIHADNLEDFLKRAPAEFSKKSFMALLHFIENFAKYNKFSEEQKWNFLQQGYWVPSTRGEYAVAIVPVLWPETVLQQIDTTGAGDITSALSLIFAGP